MSKKNRDGDNEDKKSVKRQERSAPITRSIKKVGKKAAAIVADRLRADLIVEANEVTGKDQPMVQETIGPEATERGLTEGPLNPAANVIEKTDSARDKRASELVDRLSLWSGAAGFIPVPFVVIAAVWGANMRDAYRWVGIDVPNSMQLLADEVIE